MSKYEITVSVTPLCTCCGAGLPVSFAAARPSSHPFDRDNPEERTDQRVFVCPCSQCFVHKGERNELLEALKTVVAISDRKHDAWDAAKAAIAKAEGQS
jgi:hypothetical protein